MDLLSETQPGGHKQLTEELIGMRSELKRAMDKGLTPAEMSVAKAAAEAVDAAGAAIDKMYAKLHG